MTRRSAACKITISIRAPARGATYSTARTIAVCLFQSALPRGERRVTACGIHRGDGFQSALPRGERREVGNTLISISRFQSALPRGERPPYEKVLSNKTYFNPRSREGSDINFHQKNLFSLSKNCLIHLFFITNFLN